MYDVAMLFGVAWLGSDDARLRLGIAARAIVAPAAKRISWQAPEIGRRSVSLSISATPFARSIKLQSIFDHSMRLIVSVQ